MQGLDQLAGGLDGLGVAGTVAGGAVAVASGVELGDALRLVAKDVVLSFLPIYAAAPILGLAMAGIRDVLGYDKKAPVLGMLLGAESVGQGNAIQLKLTRLAAVKAGYAIDHGFDGLTYGTPAFDGPRPPDAVWLWTADLSRELAEAFARGESDLRAVLESPFWMMLFHGAQALWDEYEALGGTPDGMVPEPTLKPTTSRRKVLDRLGVPRYSEYQAAAEEAAEVKAQAALIASGAAYQPQSYLESALGGASTLLQGAVSAAGGLLGSSGAPGGSAPALQSSAAPAAALPSSSSSTTVLLLVALAVLALLLATAR